MTTEVVLDAQLLSWFYKTSELGKKTPCTASPVALFSRLGRTDRALLDEGGKIEAEWRRKVDNDWLEAWLAERFQLGDVVEIKVENCAALLQQLRTKCGFSLNGGDKWYVRAAGTRSHRTGKRVYLISEDLDFFEPKAKKRAGNRDRILKSCKGCVVKTLAKQKVDVRTAAKHLE